MAPDSAHVVSTAEKMPAPPQEPPNGGLLAWSKVAGSFLIFVNTWGIASGYGVFQAYYETTLFPWQSTSSIAWIGSIQAFLLVVEGIFAGPLFDLGFLRYLLIVGNFLIVFSMFMLSLSTQYWQVLLSQGICFGIGSGLLYVPAIALVATQFTTKRAVAVGLASTGSAVGGIVYPILFRQLQPRIGFGWTVRTIAFIAMGVTALSLILLRPEPRTSNRRKMFQWTAWTEAPFAFYSLALFLGFLAFWIPFVYVPTFALLELKTSEDLAFYMLCIVNAGSFCGRILPALAAQKFGPMQVFVAATISCSVLLYGWIGVHDIQGFFVFSALFGFCSGVLVSIPPATIPHPVLSPSLDIVGTRLGMSWSMTGMGVLVGSPIAGALVDTSARNVSFLGAQAFAGSCMAAAAVTLIIPFLAILRYERRRRSDTTHVESFAASAVGTGPDGGRESVHDGEMEREEEVAGKTTAEKSTQTKSFGNHNRVGDGDDGSRTVKDETSQELRSDKMIKEGTPDSLGAESSVIARTSSSREKDGPG